MVTLLLFEISGHARFTLRRIYMIHKAIAEYACRFISARFRRESIQIGVILF